MVKIVEITNYKSIDKLKIELGRFNVLIGENGCGKSNILESLVFSAIAVNGKIENDYLSLRGVRVTDPKHFRSGFEVENLSKDIQVKLIDDQNYKVEFVFKNDNKPFSKWEDQITYNNDEVFDPTVSEFIKNFFMNLGEEGLKEYFDYDEVNKEFKANKEKEEAFLSLLSNSFKEAKKEEIDSIITSTRRKIDESLSISNYMVFAPENFFLRNLVTEEPFVEPLGYRGEGLLKLIKVIKKENRDQYEKIISHLSLIDWFEKIEVDEDESHIGETDFKLSDKYLEEGIKYFDIKNSNEGFLFVLFFITLFISDYTPKFFAVDNIDTALNPKLCSKLITLLSELSKKYNKQVILTTHNPSILDGLNLNDDNQRLFAVSRNKLGKTRVTRIEKKSPIKGESSTRLSEQFLRGYIGGIPKNF